MTCATVTMQLHACRLPRPKEPDAAGIQMLGSPSLAQGLVILGTVTITLITGANKGLGRETARRLLQIGHTVLVGARNAERGQRTAGELGAVFLEIDPTSDASVAAAAERVRSEYGRLDVLVNNAGTAEPRVGAADLTADEAMEGFGINVFGPSGSRTRSCRSCAPRIIPGS